MTEATITARKDFLSVLDFDAVDLERCLELAAQVKADRLLGRHAPTADVLDGHHVAMLFDKPSLRTRTTFEIAIRELGGHLVALKADVALGGASRSPTSPAISSGGSTPSSSGRFRSRCCRSSRRPPPGCTW
jgi:hypothetical protein